MPCQSAASTIRYIRASLIHRPTWNPTQGRETKSGSRQVSKLAAAAHTKLKFRQPGQTNQGDVQRRDLKAELAAAERVAEDKKRKAAGLPPLPPLPTAGSSLQIQDTPAEDEGDRAKRRKLLEEALEADKDDDSDSESEEEKEDGNEKADNDDDDDDEDSDEYV